MATDSHSVDAGAFVFSPQLGPGPEDVQPLPDGSFLTGLEDGRILRIAPDFDSIAEICRTGGRPLGMDLLPDGQVVICDARCGLLALDPARGEPRLLADRADDGPITLCNNPAVGADGSVWFSASSTRHDVRHADIDIGEAVPTGRLLRRHPDGRVETVLTGLHFANGVVIAPDGSHVLVAETGAARIRRYWLTGDRAGRNDVFLHDLKGLPDNLNLGDDGLIWAALVAPSDDLKRIARLPYPLRWLVARLYFLLAPAPARRLHVAAFDFDGRIHHDIALQPAPYHFITSVREVAGTLFLCSIREDRVARVPLRVLSPPTRTAERKADAAGR